MKDEKNKRIIPNLLLEFDALSKTICIFNDSACIAKNITIDDITISLDYDFKNN